MARAPGLSRRGFLCGSGALAVSPLVANAVFAEETPSCRLAPTRFEPDPQMAVSLRRLIAKAVECPLRPATGADPCANFHPMGGMTRLDGFVVDRANRDVVLWGLAEPDAPPLMLDDLVVAIRAAHGGYPVIENGREVTYQPGISIDANYEMWRKLDGLTDMSDPKQRKAYEEVCATPMHLRVDGMPRHTRVADILLAADFRMKLVNEGKATIPIKDFFKGIDARDVEQEMVANRIGAKFPRPKYEMNRWWFRAGSFTFQETALKDAFFLATAQIVLSHEAENVANGQLVSANVVAPDEAAYICDWNSRMEETFRAEAIWRQMYNVYRHFAIGRILAENGILESLSLNDKELLRDYRVKFVDVPDSLPGQSLMTEVPLGKNSKWTFAFCGGVSIDFDNSNLKKDLATVAPSLGDRVVARRPHPGAAAWRV
jgi:hypothetical protein